MKISFLGTNGWYDTKTGNTPCVLVESEKYYIIFDAGNGIHKLDEYIPENTNKPIFLFLSHLHLDHIIGLHILNKFKFCTLLTIVGPSGLKYDLNNIMRPPYTLPFSKLHYRIRFLELPKDRMEIPFDFKYKRLDHSSTCLGYRLELDGKVIAYCTDTGLCNNLILLGKNSDLLITECSYERGFQNPNWPHLNPDDIIALGRHSGAKRIGLIHFDANRYKTLKDRKTALKYIKKHNIYIVNTFDGKSLSL